MPDITMCTSKTCERRGQCYRSTAKPDKIQSYADFECLLFEDFPEHWNIDKKNNKIKIIDD